MALLVSRRPSLVLLATLFLVGGLTAARAFTATDGSDGEEEAPPPAANTENAALFLRLGLGADVLSAAGVASGEVPDMASAIYAAVAGAQTSLADLDQSYAAQRTDVDRLRRKVRSGLASAQEVEDLASAKTALAAAESSRDAHLDGLRAAALAEVDATTQAKLAQVWANRTWNSLPVEFLVEERTEAEWVLLRDDLDAERIAADEGTSCPSASATHLAECRADSSVSTAKVNLDSYLAGVQTAWNGAVQ